MTKIYGYLESRDLIAWSAYTACNNMSVPSCALKSGVTAKKLNDRFIGLTAEGT